MTAPTTTLDPLAAARNISANAGTSAEPQGVADRVDTLNQAGHNWMSADMQTTLAAAPTSDSEMVQIADSIKSTLANAWNGFSEATDDNVLHKQPTTGLALARLMNASLGPLPVAQSDLLTIQTNLQAQGFGAGLSTSGVWGADWNDAYNQYKNRLIQRQLAGDQPGSTSVGHAAHSLFSDLLPSHAINAIVGFAKSLPGDVRSLAADSVAQDLNYTSNPLHDLRTFGSMLNPITGLYEESTSKDQSGLAKHAGASVESLGRQAGPVSAAQYEHAHGVARLAQNVGLLLNLVPIAGQGSAAFDVARGAFEEGVSKDAASRGPGVIAKSLFGGQTTDQAATGAARRGVLNSNVIRNIPLLGQTGPVVGRLADEDGLYYKARTLLAAPYQRPIVRVAGDIGQRTMLTGAAVRAGAQATQAVGLGNTETQDVTQGNATNYIDQAINGITGTKAAHPFTDAVNALGYVLHGPLGDTANSVHVGDAVESARNAGAQMLGQYGAEGIWERAITKATGRKTTIDDLHKSFGSSEEFERFMQMKIADLAAAHHAQNEAQTVDGLTSGDDGYREAVGRHADDVWNNPDLHQTAIRELMAQDGGIGLENRVATDAVHNSINPKNIRAGDSATLDGYTHNAKAWMEQGAKVTDWVRNGDARYLFGGQGQTLIRDAQDNFDFGMGQSSPLRVGPATSRRQFVDQVNQAFSRVQRGVNKARITTGRDVAGAQQRVDDAKAALANLPEDHPDRELHTADQQQAQNDLAAAKSRNARIEAAISSKNMNRLASIMKDIAGPNSAHVDWDQLVNDHRRLKAMIGQTLSPGERFDLAEALERGSLAESPDAMYSRLNGEPRIPDEDIGSGDWISRHVNTSQGALGIARIDTKTVQQATGDINRFRARGNAAGDDPDKLAALADEMADYGFSEFGLTRRTLGLYNDDPHRLADVLQEHASALASDVFVSHDAPARLTQQIAAMRDAGYKPVLGSHIGHLWDGSLPPIEDLKGAVTKRRRITDALGLGLNSISPRTAGQDASIRVLREVDQALRSPRATLPRNLTAETVLQVLRDDNLLSPEMKLPERVAFTITKRLHQPGIDALADTMGGDKALAERTYVQELSRALQVRDIPRKQMMQTLTTPGEGIGPAGPWQWEGLDTPTASLVIRAIQRGYAHRPNYIQGLGALEDKFRGSGFWVGDKLAVKFPNTGPLQAFANAPNELVQLRNRARFTLNPFFDLRRIAKQNYKMSLDDVTPVLSPLKYLIDHDQLRSAHRYLDTLIGKPPVAGFDDADRYLHEQSVWGAYNSRHFEAYYASQKKAAGATDEEVRQGIHRVFEYGSARSGGRTPLERSVNTVFFPFSFEKTLLRNTGAYLLDHPQQALLLTSAMEAYRKANQNDAVSQWAQDHLPVLRDMQKMNAFAHGISPGELGGINAPLLNLFLPQEWGQNFTKANLKRNLPIWNDFGQLLHDSLEQGHIAYNAGDNAVSYGINLGKPRAFLNPYKPTITPEAQRRDAEVMKNKIILAFTPALNYNAHQATDADKISFPDDPSLPPMIQGQPVNHTTIGYLVQRWYPAYDPSFGQQFAIQQENDARAYISKLRETDPSKAQQYTVFSKLADAAKGHLERGDYDTAQAAEVMTQFRQAATDASETDSGFYRFFRDHYQWEFGPLENIRAS
jgi:hypothetical protein